MRDAEHAGRRQRRAWEAALGGRSSLVAPLTRTRTIGGVQPPSIGVVAEKGEVVPMNHPGNLTVSAADPYPVLFGGAPRITVHLRTAPTSSITMRAYRNGVAVGSAFVISTQDHIEEVEDKFVPGDLYHLGITSIGTGGAQGLVAATEFRPSLG